MPNWVKNFVIITGKDNDIQSMLNTILVNSGEEKCNNLQDAYNKVIVSAKHNVPNEESAHIILENGLSFGSLFPIPESFLLYDTTNYPDRFPDAVKEQQKGYGVVGWYDYNCKYFGCKYDCELILTCLVSDSDTGTATLRLECDTPWSPPIEFLERMKEKFGVNAYIASIDEGLNFAIYGEIGGEVEDITNEYFANKKQQDTEEEPDDWENDDYSIIEEIVVGKMEELCL